MTVVKSLFGGIAALVLAYFAWVYALMRRFPGGMISISPGVLLQPGMLLRQLLILQQVLLWSGYLCAGDVKVSRISGVRVRATLFILAVGVLAAFAVRQFVTGWSGLTFTGQLQTGYVPFNIVAFWLVIAATVVVVVLRWLAR